MSVEKYKAITRNMIDGMWNRRDMSVADQFIDPNLIPRGPFSEQLPSGPEGMKTFASAFISAFPDLRCTIDKQEVNGDTVKTWVTFVGTQTGDLMEIPATGKQVTVPVLVNNRIAGDKIVESWTEWDAEDMMRQLGV